MRLERREIGLDEIELLVARGLDGVPRQRVFERDFADLRGIVQHVRQNEIRLHALELRGRAADAVELANGDLDGAGVVRAVAVRRQHVGLERVQVLHRALAVRRDVADDERAAVILQRRRRDLRGGRAEAVNHHRERPGVKLLRVGDGIHLHLPVGIAREDDRAVLDEQAGELDGLLQRAAGVRAQVNDDAGNFFRLQPVDQFGDVRRGGFGRGVAVVAEVDGGVKRRQVNDADAPAVGKFHQLRLGFGILELDLVADERDHLARGVVRAGAEGQANLGALRPANLLDHFFQVHVHHVHRRLVALRDGDDAVFFVHLLALRRRAAGHERADGAIAVVLAELRADAEQREVHADGKILRMGRAEIIRVRVVGVAQPVQVGLQHPVAVPVCGHVQVPLVMLF